MPRFILSLSLILLPFVAHSQFAPLPKESEPQYTTTLRGVVTDESGRPVPGAPVVAIFGWEEGSQAYTMNADDAGRFVFENLAPGYWFLSVDQEAYAREWEHERGIEIPVLVEESSIAIKLDAPRKLSGRVVDERGSAVPGATVTVCYEWVGEEERHVQGNASYDVQVVATDNEGRFTLERLRPGYVSLVLEHPKLPQTRVDRLLTGTESNTLTMKRGTTLRGRVMVGDAPAAGIRVAVNTLNESKRSWGRWEVVTASDGSFSASPVPNLPGYSKHNINAYTVFVTEPGWGSAYYKVYQYEDDVLPEVTIAAERGDPKEDDRARIEVGKRAPDGKDAGAVVRIALALPAVSEEEREGSVLLRSVDKRERTYFEHESLDTDGVAIFEGVPAGNYIASFSSNAGVHHFASVTLDVAAGEAKTIILRPGEATLTGRIPGADTHTGKQYVSWFMHNPETKMSHQGGAYIHPDGRYEAIGLMPGNYRLVYEGDGIMKNEFRTTVVSGQNRFDLAVASGTIVGRLVDVTYSKERSRDIPAIWLLPSGITMMSGNLAGHTNPNDDGNYRFERVPDGRYIVKIEDAELKQTVYARATVTGRGLVTADLVRPERSGQVEGIVGNLNHDPSELQKLFSSLSLVLVPRMDYGYEFSAGYWDQIDSKTGHYRMRNLPEGIYGLKIASNEKLPALWIPNIEVRDGMVNTRDIELPEGRQVVIELDRGELRTRRSLWHLRMSDGTPIPFDYFIGSSGDAVAYPREFRLACGKYVVEADFGDGVFVEQPIEVEPGEETQRFVVRHPALTTQAAARP